MYFCSFSKCVGHVVLLNNEKISFGILRDSSLTYPTLLPFPSAGIIQSMLSPEKQLGFPQYSKHEDRNIIYKYCILL